MIMKMMIATIVKRVKRCMHNVSLFCSNTRAVYSTTAQLSHVTTQRAVSVESCHLQLGCNKNEGHSRSTEMAQFDIPYRFLLVICSNVSVSHHFRDITNFAVYVTVTVCDLKKSFSFDTTVEVKSQVCFLIQAKHIIVNVSYIPRHWSYEQLKWPSRW